MSRHRLRDCFANCLCVAMEERLKVAIARKSRIRALHAHPQMLPSISAFDNATSSHRNSAQHMEKFVVQRNEFVCSCVMSETFKQLIQKKTCLTSQIFAIVDFAKHRPGMRRLHLRHCGNIRQYSHGSMFTPSTPQLEQVTVTSWRLGAISETIEQK